MGFDLISRTSLLRRSPLLGGGALLALFAATAGGCHRKEAPPAAAKPPEVLVEQPVSQVVTEYEEFTGRTTAVQTVEIRARVSGVLEKVLFVDGAVVTAGAPLFEIDNRPFVAEEMRTRAAVEQAQAGFERLKLQEDRAELLIEQKAIPEEQFEQIRYDRIAAQAAVAVAEANHETALLNLGYTRIAAPITGRISRRLVDPGNLIQADVTPLTTIVTRDPIFAYFDVDERTVLRLRRLALSGEVSSVDESQLAVQVALADDADYPLSGTINFSDNQVDPNTGTLRMRAAVNNPQQLLSPGLFVRIRIPIGKPHSALTVPEVALGTDQGQRFVYVVNDQDEVVYKRVEIGTLKDGKRVIEEGLAPSDRVVVNGLQRVRAGTKVTVSAAETTVAGTSKGKLAAAKTQSRVGGAQ